MSADFIVDEITRRMARLYGKGVRNVRARVISFGPLLTCSINYSKLLRGSKYFFGLPPAILDSTQVFPKTKFGEFVLLVCGAADRVLVFPRAVILEMMRGVVSRRLDVFVEGETYILQTTGHPKRDVTEYVNNFPRVGRAEAEHPGEAAEYPTSDRIHVRVQSALISLGRAEGCRVWVPINDRGLSHKGQTFAERTINTLPNFGFDETTRRIVQNIDVLWLRRNVILKAFEIESTTSVYSGLLRLNGLALAQPNISIALYVAAAKSRRPRVYNQLLRPSFHSLLRKCEFVTFEHISEKIEQIRSLSPDADAQVTGLLKGERFSIPEHALYPDDL